MLWELPFRLSLCCFSLKPASTPTAASNHDRPDRQVGSAA